MPGDGEWQDPVDRDEAFEREAREAMKISKEELERRRIADAQWEARHVRANDLNRESRKETERWMGEFLRTWPTGPPTQVVALACAYIRRSDYRNPDPRQIASMAYKTYRHLEKLRDDEFKGRSP